MRAPDKYRQVWPDTVATIEKTPATVTRGALYVLQLATVAAVVYFLTVFAFSL